MATSTIKTPSGLETRSVTMGGEARYVFKSDSGIVEFYWDITGLSSTETTLNFGTMPEGFRPKAAYAIFSLHERNSPYLDVATVWFAHTGSVYIYKPAYLTAGYLWGEYMTGL